jgi:hypothetical protein
MRRSQRWSVTPAFLLPQLSLMRFWLRIVPTSHLFSPHESDPIIRLANPKLIFPQTGEQVKDIGGRRCHSRHIGPRRKKNIY